LGKIVGTPDYVSPDHIEAPWNPTPAWDVYSLGCTLFYAVTGKVPFPGGSTNEKILAHLQRRPLNPRRFNRDLSDRFVDVIADMMAKKPADRIPSAKEVAARLSPWIDRPGQGVPWNTRQPAPAADDTHSPPSSDSSFDVSARAESDALDDTQGSLSAIHESLDSHHEPPGQASQATHPVAVASEETFSALRRWPGGRTQPAAILGPFAVLVLFPLAVVAAILLAWCGIRWFF
jgi:eukaryotic-like serine/threonine-protein kinase